ncbi:MAG TPA: hypothetical protein VJN89_11760 [Candidatus Acidoferrum sp.]|nr:hypothetical protein [Candidatus Acidoferrum sp.]
MKVSFILIVGVGCSVVPGFATQQARQTSSLQVTDTFQESLLTDSQEARSQTLPFVETKARNMIVIPVEVRGHEVLMQLDTGAASTYLDLKALRIKPQTRRIMTVTGVFGDKRLFVFPGEVTVAGLTLQSNMVDADFKVLREVCGCAVVGVLGVDSMKQFESVSFDLAKHTVTLVRKRDGRLVP